MSINHTRPLALAIVLSAAPVSAQPPPQPPPRPLQLPTASAGAIHSEELKVIAQGWALLAAGNAAPAVTHAERVLATYPRSAAALSLVVEAAIVRSAAAGGLKRYEQWLDARPLEESLIVRRLAHAALREEAAQKQDVAARLEALRALAAAGDAEAEAELGRAAYTGGNAEARTLASLGDERAVKVLLRELNSASGSGSVVMMLDALGQSGSRLALPAATAALGDSRSEVRGAAVDAIAKIAGAESADRLATVAADPKESLFVRARAASALFRMGDERGRPMLQELAASNLSDARLLAVEAMASRPDQAWMTTTRQLTEAPEPHIRAAAARLIAPHDPELARTVLEPLMADENPAVRELASNAFGDTASGDLTALRRLMSHRDRLTRVRAAGRILVLTR